MDAAITPSASTPAPLEGVLGKFGLRMRRRGRRLHLLGKDARSIASVDALEGPELGQLCEALLQHGRQLGRKEVLTAVKARLDRAQAPG